MIIYVLVNTSEHDQIYIFNLFIYIYYIYQQI